MSDGTMNLPPEMQAEVATELAAAMDAIPQRVGDELAAAGVAEPELDTAASVEGEKAKSAAKAKSAEPAKVEETPSGALALRLARQAAALKAERATHAATVQSFEAQKTQVERLHGELTSMVNLAKADPLAWIQKQFGLTTDAIAERLLNGGKPGPGEAQSAAERRVAELEKWKTEREAQEATARQAAANEKAIAKFVAEARGDEARWPLASKYDDAELAEMGMAVVGKMPKPGTAGFRRIEDDEILDLVEEKLGKIASLRGGAPAAPAKPGAKPAAKPAARSAIAQPAVVDDIDPDAFMEASVEEQNKMLRRALGRTLNGASAGKN